MTTLDCALDYLSRGWSVIPLRPKSKKPLIPWEQFQSRLTTEYEVRGWFERTPDLNIGIVTGKLSGLFVVDLDDGTEGATSWASLCHRHGCAALKTRTASTVSGGRHLLFRYPENAVLRNTTKQEPHIDTRGEGGYIVAAPSYVEDLTKEPPRKGAYAWVDESEPIAEMPGWLIEVFAKTPESVAKPQKSSCPEIPDNSKAAIARTLLDKYISSASIGNRNENGFQLALQLRDNGFTEQEAAPVMEDYAADVPQSGERYRVHEALASLREAYKSAPREPSFVSVGTHQSSVTISDDEFRRILTQPADHEGHFQVFDMLHGKHVCYTRELGWLVYHDGFWDREAAPKYLSECITDTLRKRQIAAVQAGNKYLRGKSDATRSNIEAIKAIAQDRLVRTAADFNRKGHLLNCGSGVLDYRNMEVSPHAPEHMFDYKIPVNWNPDADTLEWNQFVADCVGEDVSDFGGERMTTLELLQLCAGYSITGDTSAETMFYLFGPPRSGKGTFMTAIQNLLGPLAGTVNIGTLCAASKSDSQNFELAGLSRCRYVTAAETGRDTFLDAGRIKNLTGNDPIQCAFKFKDTFRYTPKFKLWISSNHEVNVDAGDDAVWDRLRAFHFLNSHKDNPDTMLKHRLTTNLEPVLLWCAYGAHAWYKMREKGLPMPRTQAMRQYLQERKDEADYIKQFLQDKELSPGTDEEGYIPGAELYGQYKDFCLKNHVEKFLSLRNFISDLKRRGFNYKQKKHMGHNTRGFLVTEGTGSSVTGSDSGSQPELVEAGTADPRPF